MKDLKKPKQLTEKQQIAAQKEKDAKTSIWFTDYKTASNFIFKLHQEKIQIKCFAENNMVILNRDFTKKEYNLLFPMVKQNLL